MVQLLRRAQSALDTQLKTLPGGDNLSTAELTLRLSSIGDGDMHRNAHVDLSHDKLPLSRPPKVQIMTFLASKVHQLTAEGSS